MYRSMYSCRIVKHAFYCLIGTLIPTGSAFADTFKTTSHSIQTLNNVELISRAQVLRTSEMSSIHRSLNYQWLDNHQHDNAVVDGKALSELGDRIFGDYIERQRDNLFRKKKSSNQSSGRINLDGIDYNVGLSANKFNIDLTYQF